MGTKKTNPLFVVTNKGRDVEAAVNAFDAFVKKLGLSPALDALKEWLMHLLSQVQSYATFMAVKKILDDLVAQLEKLTKMFMPELYFYKK